MSPGDGGPAYLVVDENHNVQHWTDLLAEAARLAEPKGWTVYGRVRLQIPKDADDAIQASAEDLTVEYRRWLPGDPA